MQAEQDQAVLTCFKCYLSSGVNRGGEDAVSDVETVRMQRKWCDGMMRKAFCSTAGKQMVGRDVDVEGQDAVQVW